MTTSVSVGDDPDEAALREALEAGLASARVEPLVEAAAVERSLRREFDGQCERAEHRKLRMRDRRGGGGRGWR